MPEEQRTKTMFCKMCGKDRNFVSTLSPKGDWVCTICRHTEAGTPFKLEMGLHGYKIMKISNKNQIR